ncbi:SPOR domain-containing protein [Conchiformibius steedae DSM 2580]|uniref:SPOR domain-containing protein n=1 Tax=Conchiformibius steedae DSM 2580 TaxID=1121352 RepID=A0AAE9HW41_9NEIS|nr:SPOR domain-containing protein [Conchiformibius steedae]QMT32711.1 SPOR domain-containing protein [Conchiformibius steedae]URD67320.1 SPOR domain-containing protein [Conchiformibius steedae DSM 2580]
MSSQKNHFLQKGKGLVGFLAGLVLATMIIIAVLLMLNSNSKRDFRNDPALGGGASGAVAQTPASDALPEQGSEAVAVQQPTLPAETAPAQTAQTTPADNAAAVAESKPAAPAAETAPAVSAETAAAAAGALAGAKAAQQSADNSSNLNQPQRKPVPVSPPPVAVAPKPVRPQAANTAPAARPKPKAEVRGTSVFRPHENNTARYRPAPAPRPERNNNLANNRPKPAAPKAVEPIKPTPKPAAVAKQQPAKDPKPTPQMILETGNIDKAREAAKRQANTKSAPKTTAAAKPESKPKAQASANKGGTVVFQTGSFASARAADAQRARLAMMGVQTKISEAKIDGKSVYRVQTAPMSGERAGNTRNTLNKNGVNVYERSGQ